MGNVEFGQEGKPNAQVAGGFLFGQTTDGRQGQARCIHD
jgi:hypothetical protein